MGERVRGETAAANYTKPERHHLATLERRVEWLEGCLKSEAGTGRAAWTAAELVAVQWALRQLQAARGPWVDSVTPQAEVITLIRRHGNA